MALWYDASACLAERLGELSCNPCEMVMSLSALTHGLLLAWRLVNKEGAMGGSMEGPPGPNVSPLQAVDKNQALLKWWENVRSVWVTCTCVPWWEHTLPGYGARYWHGKLD